MTDQSPLFVVVRIAWRVDADGTDTDFSRQLTERTATEQLFVPIAAFATRAAADARVRELELEAARLLNPFSVLGPLLGYKEGERRARLGRLAALVGPLPANELTNRNADFRSLWRAWWDEQMPGWSDETLAAVWELFDAVRFYAVLEVEAE